MAPRFDPFDPVNEDENHKLYDYYGKPRDWERWQRRYSELMHPFVV